MFDMNFEGSIEKDEMYNLMMMFLEVMGINSHLGDDVNKLRE